MNITRYCTDKDCPACARQREEEAAANSCSHWIPGTCDYCRTEWQRGDDIPWYALMEEED